MQLLSRQMTYKHFISDLSRRGADCAWDRSQMSEDIVLHLNIDVNVAHVESSCGRNSLSVDDDTHICHIIMRDKKYR